MINGAWDVVIVFLLVSNHSTSFAYHSAYTLQWYYWIETKGKSLEEIDEAIEGTKHSDVPDLEMVKRVGMKEAVKTTLVTEVSNVTNIETKGKTG